MKMSGGHMMKGMPKGGIKSGGKKKRKKKGY